MQNQIKIILALFLLIASCGEKKVGEVYYQYTSIGSDSIVLFENSSLELVKENLYISNEGFYLGCDLFEDVISTDSNSIMPKRKGVLLFSTLRYNLTIDTASYTFLIPNQVAMDKDQMIVFPKGNHKLPVFDVLKLNPEKLIQLKGENTYLKDNRFVYCLPTNTNVDVDPKDFETEIRNGVTFGKIGNQYYYLDEPIAIDEFFQNVR